MNPVNGIGSHDRAHKRTERSIIMSTKRNTVASAHARIDVLDTKVDRILALLEANAPAKAPAKKPARKAPAKKAAPKPATKGAQTRETLSRKDWNRTLTAKARFAGGDTYKRVLGAWEAAQQAREAGMTPDEALATLV